MRTMDFIVSEVFIQGSTVKSSFKYSQIQLRDEWGHLSNRNSGELLIYLIIDLTLKGEVMVK